MYKKRGKRGDKFTPKIITYVDGPFYPDKTLAAKDARAKLRDEAYNAMCERSKLSDYDMIVYLKKPAADERHAPAATDKDLKGDSV